MRGRGGNREGEVFDVGLKRYAIVLALDQSISNKMMKGMMLVRLQE